MDAQALPDDVLHSIFCYLPGLDAIQCRLVCIRWREAVDSLPDRHWRKICNKEALQDEYDEYHHFELARNKYGLSWRDSYKAINSWRRIGSYDMSSHKLCDDVDYFKVLPKGIVACLQNKRHKECYNCSDTIVYCNTETLQECSKEEIDFAFFSASYEENEYFKVFIRRDGNLCIIVNETKELFVVGTLDAELSNQLGQYSVIDKEVYFHDYKDNIIYVSKLIKEAIPTIKTTPLEAFLKNCYFNDESIVQFAIKDGDVAILSDEGSKGNIYIHKNAEFDWVTDFDYDQGDIYIFLQRSNFYWRSPVVHNWLSSCTNLACKPVFYSHAYTYVSTRSFGKTICIHYYPYFIYSPNHLVKVLQGKPSRRIFRKQLIPDEEVLDYKTSVVSQVDINETSTSHQVLVRLENKLFVLEFTHPSQKYLTSQTIEDDELTIVTRSKKLQVKRESSPAYSTAKKVAREKKTSAKKDKKKVMQGKRNQSETLPHKHSYSTRSSLN